MKAVKNTIISLALTILFAVGLSATFVLSVVMCSRISNHAIIGAKVIASSFTENHEKSLANIVGSLYESKEYEKIDYWAETLGFHYAMYADTGRPLISDEDYYESEAPVSQFMIEGTDGNTYIVRIKASRNEAMRELLIVLYTSSTFLIVFGILLGVVITLFSFYELIITASNVYKVVLSFAAITVLEPVAYKNLLIRFAIPEGGSYSQLLPYYLAEKLIILVVILVYMYEIRRLQKKIADISSDTRLKVRTFPVSLKKYARDVNKASDSINEAVAEQIKSDRLKTELISNVSHDIKTPLTSIINFSNLISEECGDNEKLKDYSDRLHRQSVRLKDLMESLIEASKASVGAVEINLVPCNVKTMLEQCVVEYEERLSASNIELVEIPFEENVEIMGDVKALSRVIDNLLVNICKYAIPGSRAYVETKLDGGKVIINFKNVAKEQINVSADELTERFVRGDASRHSEGFGLGLSIVKSLMDLMHGELEITAQYDVFEVKLIFDIVKTIQ